ncbi:MAG: phosphate ABC transporter substrate-binding/OmpA family protein [Pseudomonadota bacterium]
MRQSGILPALATSLALLGVSAGGATAQGSEVTLRSIDGSISLSGALLDFDGESYRIATTIGEISVDALQVECVGAGCPPPEALRSIYTIAGSNTIGVGLMPAFIDGYALDLDSFLVQEVSSPTEMMLTVQDQSENPLAEITVLAAGSDSGFDALLSGQAALAMSSRRVTENEVRAAANAGLGNLISPEQELIIGLDGILVLTARSNPVRALTLPQLAGIFSGRLRNWADVGGPDAPISVYALTDDTGTRGVFENVVLSPIGARITPAAQEFATNVEVSDAVAADPFGIGFAGFAFERNAQAISIREACGLQSAPTVFNIKTEEYPLARRLYLYRGNGPLPPQAQALLRYISSDEAQDLIVEAGFVDQALSTKPLEELGRRIANTVLSTQEEVSFSDVREMFGALVNAERASTTFRFETGSSNLDARAVRDVARMAELIASGAFSTKEVIFVGFTDAVGQAGLNRSLSVRRAAQVVQAIEAAAPPGALDGQAISVLGLGEISPVGCNDTFEGRSLNRRVEVWLRDRV